MNGPFTNHESARLIHLRNASDVINQIVLDEIAAMQAPGYWRSPAQMAVWAAHLTITNSTVQALAALAADELYERSEKEASPESPRLRIVKNPLLDASGKPLEEKK